MKRIAPRTARIVGVGAAAFTLALAAPAAAWADEDDLSTQAAPTCRTVDDQFPGDLSYSVDEYCTDSDGDDLTVTGVDTVEGLGLGATVTGDSVIVAGVPVGSGTASFLATVEDSNGETAEWSINISIDDAEEAPVAQGDEFTGKSGDTISGNVLANDSNVDSAEVAVGSDVSHGDLTLNSDGSFTYTSESDFEGTDTFTYTVENEGGSDEATVTLEISAGGGGGGDDDGDDGDDGNGDGDGSGNGSNGNNSNASKDSLADTGSSLTGITLTGAGALAAGAVALWFTRRRKVEPVTAGATEEA